MREAQGKPGGSQSNLDSALSNGTRIAGTGGVGKLRGGNVIRPSGKWLEKWGK